MKDIRDILKSTEIVFEIAVSVSFQNPNLMFLFRNNGEEVEIDTKNKFVTHQLTFSEMRFLDDNYPFIKISEFKFKKKVYI